ncbi:hypothetical protein EDB81DRAFT_807673 [Dactylonectria macrodidyma]|uniref:C2H2-type domain-containing protein n=1 Tax=Dactylonectria macrodidyma TaxID=307937 RepID=A0A9P9IU10_9HYPO|nr:hypothetical protein EDB81DRAFT_807673 [Dactylonectria macrodidyma]
MLACRIERQVHAPTDPYELWDSNRDDETNLLNNTKSFTLPSSQTLNIISSQNVSSVWPTTHTLGSPSEIISTWFTRVRQASSTLAYILTNAILQHDTSSSVLAPMHDLVLTASCSRSSLDDTKMRHLQQRSPRSTQKPSSRATAVPKREGKKVDTDIQPQRKRSRGNANHRGFDDDKDDSSDDDKSHTHTGIQREGKTKAEASAFACPFFRMFPIRHMDCVNRKLTRIRDVKQHIQRRHSQEQVDFYCPTCYEIFPSAIPRDVHVRSRGCDAPAYPGGDNSEGASLEAQHLLKSRVDRTLTQVDQWFAIWDILFKDKSRPANPYLGTVMEETMRMIRVFSRQEAPQLVPAVLESNKMPGREDGNLVPLLLDLLEKVQDRFEQRTRESSTANSPENFSSSGQNSTPAHYELPPFSGTLISSPLPLRDFQPCRFQPRTLPSPIQYGNGTLTVPEPWHAMNTEIVSTTDVSLWDDEQTLPFIDLTATHGFVQEYPEDMVGDLCFQVEGAGPEWFPEPVDQPTCQ